MAVWVLQPASSFFEESPGGFAVCDSPSYNVCSLGMTGSILPGLHWKSAAMRIPRSTLKPMSEGLIASQIVRTRFKPGSIVRYILGEINWPRVSCTPACSPGLATTSARRCARGPVMTTWKRGSPASGRVEPTATQPNAPPRPSASRRSKRATSAAENLRPRPGTSRSRWGRRW